MVDRFFIDSYGVESIDKLGKWVLYIDHKQALAEKDQKYQQLIAQAVRFAQILLQIGDGYAITTSTEHNEVYDFLQSPEAQAYLEEHP